MFAPHLKQLYRTCDKLIIRNLRNSGKWRGSGENNPGLDKQIQAFKKDGFDITDNNAELFINESESDFYNVSGSLAVHEKETLIDKHDTRLQIVKEKYFKENMPSLLTWSEKEQIRLLASTQPDEWTPEKIAESFPITAPIVKKLLKYPWKPANEQRISRHDASVMRNWKELKAGTLRIPEDLRQHFLKFSNRTIPPLNKKSIKIDITQEEKIGEFESIVRRCAHNETSKENVKENDYTLGTTHTANNDNNKGSKENKRMTLEQLATKIKTRLETGRDVDLPDQIILNTTKASKEQSNQDASKEIALFYDERKEETKVAVRAESDADNKVMDYPERIRIPKKSYKKGATYKVNDCYYDHDGKFLYRVLGMH